MVGVEMRQDQSAQVVKLQASLGQAQVMADLLYLWAIQYYSSYDREDRGRYVEHLFGRFGGREAIRRWITTTMAEPINDRMQFFPIEWYIIDEERGWVVVDMKNDWNTIYPE